LVYTGGIYEWYSNRCFDFQTAGLANVSAAYHKAASTDLSSIEHSTRTLAEQATKEDTPTGSTPRKRVWQYVDQWELTQSRETVLNTWRQRGSSKGSDNILLNENLALRFEITEDEEDEENLDAMLVDEAPPPELLDDELVGESPVTVSVTLQPPSKKMASEMKSGLPTLGTLTDRPTNIITHLTSRRAR
jgi:kinesin family protein 11